MRPLIGLAFLSFAMIACDTEVAKAQAIEPPTLTETRLTRSVIQGDMYTGTLYVWSAKITFDQNQGRPSEILVEVRKLRGVVNGITQWEILGTKTYDATSNPKIDKMFSGSVVQVDKGFSGPHNQNMDGEMRARVTYVNGNVAHTVQ